MNPVNSALIEKYIPYLIILSLILFVFIQNLWFDFNYIDDNLIIFDQYEKINSLSDIPQSFIDGYLYNNYYRPAVMISFIIDTAIAGQSSWMYHLTNIILHILTSLIIFHVLCKLGIKKNISLFSTIIYAIHPLNTSAVSWIVGRNDLLLALFSIAGFYFYLKFKEKGKEYNLILSLTAYFFAMLSKEAGVLLPLLIFGYEVLLRDKKGFKFKSILSLIYYIIPALIYFGLRQFVAMINVREEVSIFSFIQNIYILFEYLAKTIYFFYIDPLPVKNPTLIWIGISVFIILITYFLINKKDKSGKIFLFGLFLFFIFVLPTIFVRVPADDGIFNYIDCRMYLPLFGLIISLSVIFENIFSKIGNKSKLLLMCILIIYFSIFTFSHNQVYKNGLSYWVTAVKKNPDRATYWMGLGFYFFDKKMYPKAEVCVTKALSLQPKNVEYHHRASVLFETQGDLITSNVILEKALPMETNKTRALLKIINNYLLINDKEKAAHFVTELENLSISDENKLSEIYSSISHYYANSGFLTESIVFMKKAVRFKPENPDYLNDLGAFYYRSGNIDSAKINFLQALKLDPNNSAYKNNLNVLEKRNN